VYGNIAGVQLHHERTRERRPWTSDPAISDIGSWILDPVIGTIIGMVIVIVGAFILFVVIWP
jgi:hypothetical protein